MACRLLLLFFLVVGAAHGEDRVARQTPLDPILDSLAAVKPFREAVLSPDGKQLAWVGQLPDKKKDGSPLHGIFLLNLADPSAAPRRLTTATEANSFEEHDLAWSPDGGRLAFLSDREKMDQLQLYVADTAAGSVKRMTQLTGLLSHPRWSPDGTKIGVLYIENARGPAGPIAPGAAETGVIGDQIQEQRLSIVDLAGGTAGPVSPADLHVYEFDWSPDGKQITAIAAHGDGNNNWYIAQLYTLTLASGELKSILKPGMQIAVPRWSPDGQRIAFIGGLMSDEGVIGGDVFVIPTSGGSPHNLTPGMKASACWLTWDREGKEILASAHVDGGMGIIKVDANGGTVATLWQGDESFHAESGNLSISFAKGMKTSALVRSSFQQPPEVFVGSIGKWKQITHVNAGARRFWGEVKSLHWKSDNLNVQGWLVYPIGFDPKGRHPLLVSVHGGPSSSRSARWPREFFDWTVLSSMGYFVFFPNPRGSYGQGEEFTRANVRDFGYGDLRDIMAGVDEILKTLPVDSRRMALTGWSYGGYMTMWAVTQTNRFRAAVAGAGIANWQSYYGQNGIDQWMIPFFGASVYDDPVVYARSSPINFIKRVKTPTLILVGERDVECPVPQSYEFWHALRTFSVPTQFVIYPGEGHGISKPEHRRDIMRRSVAWFEQYLRVDMSGSGK